MPDPRSTALRSRHEALGASFTDFGGWDMPVRYSSDLAEHHAVRTAAGLFDISHMAEFVIEGDMAGDFLDAAVAGRMSALRVGKAKYTLLLAESGGIVDDLIVYRLEDERFLIIANAGNHDAVEVALQDRVEGWDATVTDVSDAHGLIAVQGPLARSVLEATAGLAVTGVALADLPYYAATHADFGGSTILIARTGYTGEDGFELLVPVERAPELWDALLGAGAPLGLVPAGLAARDTLRLEAGMPLYGHELSLDIVPAQAGLGRVVVADKPAFVGKEALAAASDADAPVLVGLASEGRRAGRAGYGVFAGDERIGEITSGALSPTLGHPIAMAYVAPAFADAGTELTIDVRGTRIPATVTALPFYRKEHEMTDLDSLKYTSEHEWIAFDGQTATVGITDYAAEKLGDIVFVELPTVDSGVSAGQVCGEIESTKSVGELYAPLTGDVVAVNQAVVDDPSLVSSDPFGEGWLLKIAIDASAPADLLDRQAYLGLTGAAE